MIETFSPEIESLRIDLLFFAECGRYHAALGVLFNERTPVLLSLFYSHDSPPAFYQEGP